MIRKIKNLQKLKQMSWHSNIIAIDKETFASSYDNIYMEILNTLNLN